MYISRTKKPPGNDRLEIWSEEGWNDFFLENADKIEDIAENLFNGSDLDETL